jgi:phosphatidylserine/phosphatidylglycerophosphate/cardiolipin synthase-like enzyme
MKDIASKESIEELIRYENKVKSLANTKSNELHYNSGADHASIVMESIFDTASEEIKIFAGNFNEEVCQKPGERYIQSLKRYLLKGVKIKVLLNDSGSIGQKNLVLSLLKRYSSNDFYKDNISVKTTNKTVSRDDFKNIHFTVGDNRMYRLEYDTQSFLAEFSFNREEKSKSLSLEFDTIFNNTNFSTAFDFNTLSN